jgi:iron complex transport system permease protein
MTAWLCLGLIGLSLASLFVGPVPISVSDFFSWITGQADEHTRLVLEQLRWPRLMMSVLTGAALATGGAVMQSLFRNPLAEPGLVGVSAGAALGAVSMLALGVTGFVLIGAAGFLGALLATALAWQFGRGWPGVAGLLLAGVAINALVFSLISLLISFASDAELRSMTFWSLGSMSRTPLSVVLVLSVWVPLGLWWIYRRWPALNALLLGEVEAAHVGVNVKTLRVSLIAAMALLVGPLVAFTGAISFVGLLVPQFVRRFMGSDHRRLLPTAALIGAMAVLSADMLSRVLIAPAQLPVGVVISLVGAPVFLWLLRQPLR